MTYVVTGMGVVLALAIGVGVIEYRHVETLDTKLGAQQVTIDTMRTALTGIQNAAKSRNTTDAAVRQLDDPGLVDKLR